MKNLLFFGIGILLKKKNFEIEIELASELFFLKNHE
jgi:hypothetical protein